MSLCVCVCVFSVFLSDSGEEDVIAMLARGGGGDDVEAEVSDASL